MEVGLVDAVANLMLEQKGLRQQNAGAEVLKAIAGELAKKVVPQTTDELKEVLDGLRVRKRDFYVWKDIYISFRKT